LSVEQLNEPATGVKVLVPIVPVLVIQSVVTTENDMPCVRMYSNVFYRHRNACEKEKDMTKTITLRLNEERYLRFRQLAEEDNRPLSNFIETAVLRYIEDQGYVDEFEMSEIRENIELNESLIRGMRDAETGKGKFV